MMYTIYIYMIDKIFADFNNTLCRLESLMRKRAQGRNLYSFRTTGFHTKFIVFP